MALIQKEYLPERQAEEQKHNQKNNSSSLNSYCNSKIYHKKVTFRNSMKFINKHILPNVLLQKNHCMWSQHGNGFKCKGKKTFCVQSNGHNSHAACL